MNCSTLVPEEHYIEKENSRRTSRGLASCLRGESDEYYEAEGNYIHFVCKLMLNYKCCVLYRCDMSPTYSPHTHLLISICKI